MWSLHSTFYLKDYDVYLEIKGRWWDDDRKKMDIVLEKYKDKKIIVVEKEKYEKILEGELVWRFQRMPEEHKNQVRFLDLPPLSCSSMVEPTTDNRITQVRFLSGQPKW